MSQSPSGTTIDNSPDRNLDSTPAPPQSAGGVTITTANDNDNDTSVKGGGAGGSSRPQTSDLPAELFRSTRSNGLGASTTSTGRRRKKKQPPPPPQAHPEPRGADEAEARMLWNRIAPLQNGNKMTTPNEPPMLYNNTTINYLPGGLQDQPSIVSLTNQFTETPRNLVAQARGPLEVFVANGSHPRIGWLVPDNAVLGIQTQSEAGDRLQLISNNSRPRTSDEMNDDYYSDFASSTRNNNNDKDKDGGNQPPHQPPVLFPPSYTTNNNNANQNSATSGASSPLSTVTTTSPSGFQQRGRSSSTNRRTGGGGGDDQMSSSFNNNSGNPFSSNNNNNQNLELIDLLFTNNVGNYRRSLQQNLQSGNFVAPQNVKDDGDTILLEKHLEECTQWMTDLATAVQNEKHLFTQWKADLHQEIKDLQLDQAKRLADYAEQRQEVQAQQRSQLYLKENDLEQLKTGREKVLDWLSEKKRVLRELKETSIAVEEAERSSTLKLLDVEEDLKKQKGRLEDVLKGKLANAVEQMSQLSEAQRKARESSTVEDFNRLVKELTEQERKMRELSSTSGKLQHRIGALRREISLETQRGQMLQEKQEGYHSTISTLVHRLEEIERKYAAQSQRELKGLMSASSSTSNNNNHSLHNNNNENEESSGALSSGSIENISKNKTKEQLQLQLQQQQFTELPRIIDQQYAVILQLRADLVRVRQEVRQASAYLQAERTAVIQAANPSTQPILSRTSKKQQQHQNNDNNNTLQLTANSNAMTVKTPHPPNQVLNNNNSFSSSQNSSSHQQQPLTVMNIVDTMRDTEMNFIKNIVFEALADADKNLVGIVKNHQKNNNNNQNSSLLPPIYPTLEVLDPVQRRDVFDFVVRRINTKLLNPLGNNSSEGSTKKHFGSNNQREEVSF